MLKASFSSEAAGSIAECKDGAPAVHTQKDMQALLMSTAATPTSAFDFPENSSRISSAPTSKAAQTLHAEDSQLLCSSPTAPAQASLDAGSQDLFSEPTVPSATVLHAGPSTPCSSQQWAAGGLSPSANQLPSANQIGTTDARALPEGTGADPRRARVSATGHFDQGARQPSQEPLAEEPRQPYCPLHFPLRPSLLYPSPFSSPGVTSGGWPAALDPAVVGPQDKAAAEHAAREFQHLHLVSSA